MDQNHKLSVGSIWANFQNFEGFFRQCVCRIELPLVKISSRSNNNRGNKSQKSQKGAISWMLNQYKKLWKFLISQPHMLYWWNLPQIYILIRSFICQNLGVWFIGLRRQKQKNPQDETKNQLFGQILTISPSKTICVIFLTKSPLKMMKNPFYFILKSLFVLKISKSL